MKPQTPILHDYVPTTDLLIINITPLSDPLPSLNLDVLYHHRASVWGLRIVGDSIVTGSMDGTIAVVNIAVLQVVKHFLAHEDEWGGTGCIVLLKLVLDIFAYCAFNILSLLISKYGLCSRVMHLFRGMSFLPHDFKGAYLR